MAKLLFLQNLEYIFLGPMYISSMVKAQHHSCRLAFGDSLKDFSKIIEGFDPDVIGFSIMTGSHRWAAELAKTIKRNRDVITLFGGAHPTFFPEFIKDEGVDIICRGEGEEAALELLNKIDARESLTNIKNLWIKENGKVYTNDLRPLRANLDFYPYPDREIYAQLKSRIDTSVRHIITSRGCPFHCSFCFEDSLRKLYKDKGKYVRIRDIDKVIGELLVIKKDSDVKTVYFCDDVFGISKRWLYDFLEIYKREVNLPFICLVRADIAASDEMYAFKLKDGGCESVFFGIESGNESLRNTVLMKGLKDEEIYKAAKLLHKAGIKFRTYNIVGLPDETVEDAFKTLQMNIDIRADYPWCSLFSPFPGTALTDYAYRKGYLPGGFRSDAVSKSFFLDSKLTLRNRKEFENLQKFFQTAVLFPHALPLIRILINLPPNILYRLWFSMVYFYVYVKSERRGFLKTFINALRNYKHVLLKA